MGQIRATVVIRHEALVDKQCPICQRTFVAVNRCKYCSRPCLYRANYLAHAEERRAKRRAQYQRTKVADQAVSKTSDTPRQGAQS